ncbi:MAG: bifunctional nuclease family protein [Armatimonadetes bacterium]|nr:bifunctional nuclease family protein [Anaerolineae bacterium]
MIEVTIDSIRVSLMTQHRVVILKDTTNERYLPIWIGPFEAEALTVELQEMQQQRPFTHDLIKAVIRELGGRVVHVLINDLRNDVFFARIVIEVNDKQIEVDARPSDAINVAVRAKAPIFVMETVLARAGIEPDEDVEQEIADGEKRAATGEPVDERRLSAFADFVNSLDLDDLDKEEDN